MPRHLDFYFFIGSTYTYLAVNRAAALARAAGVELTWHPFSLRTLLREQDNSPFMGKPAKTAYMWRDIERRARRFGIPFRGRPPYPIDLEERANHLATLAAAEGWCEDFVREAYQTWFIDGLDPGKPEVLASIVSRLGKPQDSLARAESAQNVGAYLARTDRARALGMFGAPSFVAGEAELFWGDDRLEEALDWASSQQADD